MATNQLNWIVGPVFQRSVARRTQMLCHSMVIEGLHVYTQYTTLYSEGSYSEPMWDQPRRKEPNDAVSSPYTKRSKARTNRRDTRNDDFKSFRLKLSVCLTVSLHPLTPLHLTHFGTLRGLKHPVVKKDYTYIYWKFAASHFGPEISEKNVFGFQKTLELFCVFL